MNIKELKSGELYRTLFLGYGDVLDVDGKTIDNVVEFETRIVLMLEPSIIVDSDRGIGKYSKILVNNKTVFIVPILLYEFNLAQKNYGIT